MRIKTKISIGALAASISLASLSMMNTGCKTACCSKDKAEKSCSGMKSCSGEKSATAEKSCSGEKTTEATQ